MRVRVKFLATFKALFAARERDAELVPGATVRGLLETICDTPARRAQVFDGGALRKGVVVMRNGSPARLDEPLAEGDLVAVFPFVTGG